MCTLSLVSLQMIQGEMTNMFRNKLLCSFTFIIFTSLFFSNAINAATHTIKKGEELDTIAERYNTTVNTLLEINELKDKEQAVVGYVLKLPENIEKKQKKVEEKKEKLDDFEVVKTMTVEASAFTASCKGCSGKTASGINLKKNPDVKLIAVDPKIIPLGTKVWVEGYGIAVAGDTGGSIKGSKIDVFVKSKKTALNWGRKKVEIKILK